ncbi:hypothetical protein [Mucilaginibacter pedocola]|uniref:Outer membrane protein beta-barrel domain-containing protein n=1 Tax=Mucilaginibacter pedocola TaxID=1792845 RepID=A0A1S9PJ37_9SPHI|nr:hypothetical protein [Mucilaginibacter pedocola]OOQ60980.1 hypothetical protein BC343_21230 [Mucilaginibacter pedocola]
MMKKLLAIALVLIGFCAKAQERKTVFEKFSNNRAIGIGISGYLPHGNFFKNGYGASVKSEWPIAQDLSLIGTLSVARFNYKSEFKGEALPTKPATFIPLTAGARYFLGDKIYFEGLVGGGYVADFHKSAFLSIEASAGYIMRLNKTNSFDFSVGYNNWGSGENLKATVLKVAYRAEWF